MVIAAVPVRPLDNNPALLQLDFADDQAIRSLPLILTGLSLRSRQRAEHRRTVSFSDE
jgi:hypothetical protein